MTLQRRTEVEQILFGGGHAIVEVRAVGYGIATLYGKDGIAIEAWQQAIWTSLRKCKPVADAISPMGRAAKRWEWKS